MISDAEDFRTITPAEGARVLCPLRGMAVGEGERVAWSSYWQRRLDDGDIALLVEAGGTKKKGA